MDTEEMKTVHDIAWHREQLGFEEDKILREAGWKHTSSTPGCYWLWEKKLADGRIILCEKDMALAIQRNLQGDPHDAEPNGGGNG